MINRINLYTSRYNVLQIIDYDTSPIVTSTIGSMCICENIIITLSKKKKKNNINDLKLSENNTI